MQTVIRLKPNELNQSLLERIKEFIKGKESADITLTISENEDYLTVLNRSVKNIEDKKGIVSFTFEEFANYKPQKVK